MRRLAKRKILKVEGRPPFECIALLLQGGGALGAYQGGVYEALHEAGLEPDWVGGISIGAINSAIIVGNPPEHRVARLREFWQGMTEPSSLLAAIPGTSTLTHGEVARSVMNHVSAGVAMMSGVAGFFSPRLPPPWLYPDGNLEATSYYDTAALRDTLLRLVDFQRVNHGPTRLSVGAVNVRTGNFVYFDTTTHQITPEHIMASGALPPALPAMEIDGEHYWDGGLVSNTPLEWVLDTEPHHDTLAFQVDLWSARGDFPRNILDVATRLKEIQYSSRTRANSDRFKYTQRLRNALASLLKNVPDEFEHVPEIDLLREVACPKVYNLIQLIYHSRQYENDSKDYEFSRLSMEEHWRTGYNDTVRTLRHPEVLQRPGNLEGVFTFDVARDGRG